MNSGEVFGSLRESAGVCGSGGVEEGIGSDSSTPADSRRLPAYGRLLGLDPGTVRVGLAISDPDRLVASPLETYAVRGPTPDAAYFAKLVAAERVVGIVVGLPLHTGGEEGIKAREARVFGAWLTEVTGLPVVWWDERCTTAAAEDFLRLAKLSPKQRKERRDRVAAQLILQGYLDAGCPPEGTVVAPPEPAP